MNLLYFNVIEQNAGWGAETFVNRGFLSLGHSSHCVDYRVHRHRISRMLPTNVAFDATLVQRGDGFPITLLPLLPSPRVFWASELVSRCRDQDRLLSCGHFDHIFCRTPQCAQTITERNWHSSSNTSVMLSGFDSAIHHPIDGVKDQIDVLFIGSLTKRRVAILEYLGKHVSVQAISAFGGEMVELIAKSKIVLNLHAADFLDTETRVYESLGCGAFLISERLSQESPFDDSHLVQCDSTEELLRAIEYYLDHEDERERISCSGHDFAKSHHTYLERCKQIISTINQYRSGRATKISRRRLAKFKRTEFCVGAVSRLLQPIGQFRLKHNSA